MSRRLSWLAGVFLLSGCSLLQPAVTPDAIPAFGLLPPSSFGGSVQTQQILNVAYGAREATMQCVVGITPQQLSMLCLTAMGQRLFSLKLDETGLQAERSPFAPDNIPAERIIADLQLAFWPLPALRTATSGTAWNITEPSPGVRRVRYGERLYAETHSASVDPWPQRLWFSSLAYGYTLDIRSQAAP